MPRRNHRTRAKRRVVVIQQEPAQRALSTQQMAVRLVKDGKASPRVLGQRPRTRYPSADEIATGPDA